MKYKLIALDIDGTLNNSNREITTKTREALIKVQQSGVKVALASGRPAPGLINQAKELMLKDYHGLLISFNGAKVVDATSGETIFEQTMKLYDAKNVLNHLKQFNVTSMINKDNTLVVDNKHGNHVQYEAEANNLSLIEVSDLEDYIDFNPCKILVSGEPEYLSLVADKIKEPFKDTLNIYFSAPHYLEIVANGIDKGNTLKNLSSRLNIQQEEMISFGDEANDLSMISYAGLGVAMGNATEKVKETANMVTLSNDEDGIAQALYKIFPDIDFGKYNL